MTDELGIVRPVERVAGERTTESAQLLLDPLQRRAELIWTYDFHGHPERARFLERAEDGPGLLDRIRESDPDAIRDLLVWWTGWAPIEVIRLEHSTLALAAAETRTRNAGAACPCSTLERLQRQRDDAGATAQARLEDALIAGLLARVNTYMAPLGLPTADSVALAYLSAWRELACGSRVAAQAPLPSVALPGGTVAHIVRCERCSVVDLHRRAARRCRRCADRHDRAPDSLRVPRSHPNLPWLVVGDTTVHVRTCATCGGAFLTTRAHAETCPGSKCRVAKKRQLAGQPGAGRAA